MCKNFFFGPKIVKHSSGVQPPGPQTCFDCKLMFFFTPKDILIRLNIGKISVKIFFTLNIGKLNFTLKYYIPYGKKISGGAGAEPYL